MSGGGNKFGEDDLPRASCIPVAAPHANLKRLSTIKDLGRNRLRLLNSETIYLMNAVS